MRHIGFYKLAVDKTIFTIYILRVSLIEQHIQKLLI